MRERIAQWKEWSREERERKDSTVEGVEQRVVVVDEGVKARLKMGTS